VPLIASNDPLYAVPEDRPLHDVLTATRLAPRCTPPGVASLPMVSGISSHRPRWRACLRLPAGAGSGADWLDCIAFTLDQIQYEYPHEPVPQGWTPQAWLEHLCWKAQAASSPLACPRAIVRSG
jgi:error-prone DNA polymerase